jgi:transposase
MYLWLKNLNEENYLYYDITSISTYSKNNHLAMRGYNRDHEKLDQINLSLLVGHQTMLPAHFRTLRGNISDVATLEKTFEYLNFFDVKNPTFVLDRGFYSKDNITYLLNNSFNFLISLPSNRKWLENIIDKYYDMIKLPNHRLHLGEGETIFCARHIMRWFDSNNKIYLHIFYQHDKVNLDYHGFLNNINRLKEQFEQGCKLDSYLKRDYIKYLIIHKKNIKTVKVVYNNDEILKYQKKYCGFFCLLSPNIKNTHDAIKIYRDRDHVEKAFDDLKNNLDLKRLRIHDSERLEAKIFIEFLTLIYSSKLRKIIRECTTSLKYLSFDEIFDALNGLIVTKQEGNKKIWCNEPDGYAKKILDYFNIDWPPR